MATIRPQFQHQDKVQHGQFTLSAPISGQPMESAEDEPDLGRPVTGSDNHIMGSEGHPVPLLAKVAKQIAMDHADQDYTAIDELFKRTPSKELEGFLSEFGTESVQEAIPTSEYDYDINYCHICTYVVPLMNFLALCNASNCFQL